MKGRSSIGTLIKMENIRPEEILNYSIKNGMLNMDDVLNLMKKEENKKILSMHEKKHKVWYNSETNQWMTYIDDPDSKRGFVLKRRKEKMDLENLIIEHYIKEKEHPTIPKVFNEWLTSKYDYGEITLQTKTRYENDFKRFFLDDKEFCKRDIQSITDLELEFFIKGCIKKHHLTKKTYNMLKILVKGIFKYAHKKGNSPIITSIFFDELDLHKNIFTSKSVKKDEDEVYNEYEIPMIKEYLLQKNSLRYLGVLLVFVTGLRVGELAALKPEDIHINTVKNTGFMYIDKTEVHYSITDEHGKRKNVVAVQEFPKTDSGNRDIILNSLAIDILQRIQSQNANPKEFLFEENGQRIKIRGFSGALKRTCENLNIPFRPMHKIRKTYGTTLLDNHVPEQLIASQMGHSDISTTKKYYYRNNKSKETNRAEIERGLSAI